MAAIRNVEELTPNGILEAFLRTTERQSHYRSEVKHCQAACRELMEQASQMLDLTNIALEQFELRAEEFDLRALLTQNLVTLEGTGRTELEMSPSIPSALSGDAKRLKTILTHLVNLASQGSVAAGVAIKVQPDPANCWHIDFTITPAVDPDTDFLGLVYARTVLRQMGSELLLREGFQFGITFAPTEYRPAAAKPPVAIPLQLSNLLIAEDSEDCRFLLHEFLKNGPYTVTFAENGREALEAVRSRTFDLIIMDIQMPVMDGLTAAKLIRESEQQFSRLPTPLLALTANARKADIELSLAAGCNAHVLKPISKNELLKAIQKYLPGAPVSIDIDIPIGLEQPARRYIAARNNDLIKLLQLLEQKEFEQIRLLAHDFKGIGASYGFSDLSRIGSSMESAAREENSEQLRTQMESLSEYIRAAEQATFVTSDCG